MPSSVFFCGRFKTRMVFSKGRGAFQRDPNPKTRPAGYWGVGVIFLGCGIVLFFFLGPSFYIGAARKVFWVVFFD